MEYSAPMTFRKPQLIPTLFIIASTLVLGGLGVWQLERLQWKQNVLAEANAAERMEVLGTLPDDVQGLSYRRVALTGTFLYDKKLRLIGRAQGQEAGYFMLTPFSLEDDGRIILVNRGFSPDGKESRPDGPQTVTGLIRPARQKRFFAPDNQPQKNIWFTEDFAAMAAATGLALTPVIVEATGAHKEGEFPIPSDGAVIMRNDHLQYAITWFALALIGLIMFALYHREPHNRHSGANGQ